MKVSFGPPLEEERQDLIAKIDAQIAELERDHSALVDAAAESGIKIELLPSVKQQRERARAIADREALQRVERREAEEALARAKQNGSRVAHPSPYLQGR